MDPARNNSPLPEAGGANMPLTTTPNPDPEGPITERTRALLEMNNHLQNLSDEIKEIRRILHRGESWRNNIWRALTNFVGFVKADQADRTSNGTDGKTPPHI